MRRLRTFLKLLGDAEYAGYLRLELLDLYKSNGLDDQASELVATISSSPSTIENPCLEFTTRVHMLLHDSEMQERNDLFKKIDAAETLSLDCDDYSTNNTLIFFLDLMRFKKLLQEDQLGFDTAQLDDKLIQHIGEPANFYFQANAMPHRAQYYREIGDYDKALALIQEVFESKNVDQAKGYYLKTIEQLALTHSAMNQPRQAEKYFKKHSQLKDSVYNASVANAFAYHQAKMDFDKKSQLADQKDQELQDAQEENDSLQSGRTLAYILMGIVGLIAVITLIWLICRQRGKRRVLEDKLSQKHQELKVLTTSMLAQSMEQEQLQEELKQKQKVNPQEQQAEIESLIASKILTAEDWRKFKSKFLVVFPDFYESLSHEVKFTNAEQRLLACEYLGLSNGEIASMLAISPESVIKTRYRLKKKLGISKSDDLLVFINERYPTDEQ